MRYGGVIPDDAFFGQDKNVFGDHDGKNAFDIKTGKDEATKITEASKITETE